MTAIVSASGLLPRYDTFLIDAYGVLVDGRGPLPHAARFMDTIADSGKQRLLLSNDASRTPAQVGDRLLGFGMSLRPEEVLTSGMMIAPWVRAHDLGGAPAIVLGPEGAQQLALDAGLRPVAADAHDARAVVICDEAGFDLVPTVEAVLTTIIRRHDTGAPTALVLPNPDILYPKPHGVGITAGAVACLVERGLRARFGDDAPRFEGLGKPHAPIFEEAKRRARGRVLMLGDQLETDVAGALAAGVDVALVETGVGRRPPPSAKLQPTWVLESLRLHEV